MEQIDEGREAHFGKEKGAYLTGEKEVFSEEQIRKFEEFAAREDCYDLLVDALAPSIWENEDVKKGILC